MSFVVSGSNQKGWLSSLVTFTIARERSSRQQSVGRELKSSLIVTENKVYVI